MSRSLGAGATLAGRIGNAVAEPVSDTIRERLDRVIAIYESFHLGMNAGTRPLEAGSDERAG